MTDVNSTVANYIAAWNETNSAKRREIIERALTDCGLY